MSGLRSNPLTGEIIDGDVIFDTSWIKRWKEEYAILVGMPVPTAQGQAADQPIDAIPLAVGEVFSPIMAAKQGYGQLLPPPGSRRAAAWTAALLGQSGPMGAVGRGEGNVPLALDVVPAGWDPIQAHLQQRLSQGRMAGCNYAAAKSHEMRFAALALMLAADADQAKKDDPKVTDPKKGEDAAKDKAKEKKEPEPKLPDEFLGQAIKEVVMHEVGHSLGLRHNFKASTMLRPDQINDTSITRVKGMTGSVMDYNPINVAPKGQKQGDYASTTIGPYDYWAIEYAYTPITGNEEAELKKIAARSPDPDLAFATDDDFWQQRPPGEYLRPDVGHPGLRQDADGHGQRDAQGAGPEGRQGRRLVGPAPRGVPGLHPAVRQRGVSRGRAHRRPVGQPRLQGRRQGPRPDHARRRLPPARGTQAPGRPDPERQGVRVLARHAPQADDRVVAGRAGSRAMRARITRSSR